jgi:hypothetical protein
MLSIGFSEQAAAQDSSNCPLNASIVTVNEIPPWQTSASGTSTTVTYCSETLQPSNGTITAANLNTAMSDAATYFAHERQSGSNALGFSFRIYVPVGTYTVSGFSSGDTLFEYPPGDLGPLSQTERLLIEGAGASETEISSSTTLLTIGASSTGNQAPFSFLTVRNIHFDKPDQTTFQGTLASSTTTTVTESVLTTTPSGHSVTRVSTQAIELSIPTSGFPGFNVPNVNFPINDTSGHQGHYIRIYDPGQNGPTIDPINTNRHLWFHAVCNGSTTADNYQYINSSNNSTATASIVGTCPTSGSTWTILVGKTPGTLSTDEASTLPLYDDNTNLVCGKNEGGNATDTMGAEMGFMNLDDDGASAAGQDVILDSILWTGAARTITTSIYDVTVVNSSVLRETSQNGVVPCLSTSSGGPQLASGKYPTYGNSILNYTAVATGDDSVAFHSDAGGSNGYPNSSVVGATIHDSFARGVLIDPGTTGVYTVPLDVFPWIGITASGTLCGGAPYLLEPPWAQQPYCPTTDVNFITSISSSCIESSSGDDPSPTFCPADVDGNPNDGDTD